MTDPIADLLTRIRNTQMSRRNELRAQHSILKEAVAKVLKANNFIDSYEAVELENNKKDLLITLNPARHKVTLNRVSKPGQRIHVSHDKIKNVKSGLGILIISTSKGVMTGQEAKKAGIGGEVLCEVY